MKNKVTTFISELTSLNNVEVINEQKNNNGWKLKFIACLQTANERNNNNRIYPLDDLQEAVTMIQPRIKNRTFLGELDHPIEDSIKRQFIVLYKECSHIVSKMWVSKNEVLGELETLSTPNGKILTTLIKDNVPIGFSVRALGTLTKDITENARKQEVTIVRKPIYIITYDSVSNPSHPTATMRELTNENTYCIGNICISSKDSDIGYVYHTYDKVIKEIEAGGSIINAYDLNKSYSTKKKRN